MSQGYFIGGCLYSQYAVNLWPILFDNFLNIMEKVMSFPNFSQNLNFKDKHFLIDKIDVQK